MEIKSILFCVFCCLLTGCSSLHVRVRASEQLNTNATYQSLPVRLKIYQLNDPLSFQDATFRQLWKEDTTVLGKSLVSKKEITLYPNQQRTLALQRAPDAEFIAVVGIFREHDDKNWKSIEPLPSSITTFWRNITLFVKNNQVEIKP